MQLSKHSLAHISPTLLKPTDAIFRLPEKVLQFGTGVLLRGLPDYFIDKANRNGIFNGRVVVIKSTDAGDALVFDKQDGLYTLCIRGLEGGKPVDETIICAAISRVLSAKQQWDEVLACAQNPELRIIISNTTKVGIQLVEESIFQTPPHSFPAKLLRFLHERFKKFGDASGELVVLPTELLTDNGKKLQNIIIQLAHYNNLEEAFTGRLLKNVHFCNTLVDCIVPGKPSAHAQEAFEQERNYTDALLTVSEAYRLWAIEGDEPIKELIEFAAADSRIIITPDITKYKELKLRLLNGTHTLSCAIMHLAGMATVKEAMEHVPASQFISRLMLEELAPAVPCALAAGEAEAFGRQVLDRFRNPHIEHRWLSISVQYSSKMAQRTITLLLNHVETTRAIPPLYVIGFAAYLLFMRVTKSEAGLFWGEHNGALYSIQDDQAAYYFNLWRQHPADEIVEIVLRNVALWGTDLSQIDGFEEAVKKRLQQLVAHGAMQLLIEGANGEIETK